MLLLSLWLKGGERAGLGSQLAKVFSSSEAVIQQVVSDTHVCKCSNSLEILQAFITLHSHPCSSEQIYIVVILFILVMGK